MKINGQQFYWFVTTGLLIGLVIPLASTFLDVNDRGFAISTLVLLPLVFAAYAIVAFEIWDRFGLGKAVIAFVLFPILTIYWLGRINGIEGASNDA